LKDDMARDFSFSNALEQLLGALVHRAVHPRVVYLGARCWLRGYHRWTIFNPDTYHATVNTWRGWLDADGYCEDCGSYHFRHPEHFTGARGVRGVIAGRVRVVPFRRRVLDWRTKK
jgi:hypothetical protein